MDDDVVAETSIEDVEPEAADQYVVSRIAIERIVAVAADQHVVAVAAIGGELDGARREPRRLDDVIAGKSIDDDPVVGGLEAG